MNLKDIELLKGAPADVLAEIKPKQKSYTVTEKVLAKNEAARATKVIKSKETAKNKAESTKKQYEQLQHLISRIDELETGNKKIKPLEIKEPVDVNKPLPMVIEEEPLPASQEEQYKAKENIIKKEIPNITPIPSLPVQPPYKQVARINSVLPFNWKNGVQKQQISQNSLNLNKYLKGRKY